MYSVTTEIAKPTVKTLVRISNTVNIFPSGPIGLTSEKPTVVTVIMVIYSASIQE
jgi:hypothetical protein